MENFIYFSCILYYFDHIVLFYLAFSPAWVLTNHRLQAMARSIGDHAVKGAGVVATPEVQSMLRGRKTVAVLTPLELDPIFYIKLSIKDETKFILDDRKTAQDY